MPAAAPSHDNQKRLQTLPSILSEAEWPPDEGQTDFYLSGVIPGSLPSVEHLWGKNSRQRKAVGRVQAPGRGCVPLCLPKAGMPVTHRSLGEGARRQIFSASGILKHPTFWFFCFSTFVENKWKEGSKTIPRALVVTVGRGQSSESTVPTACLLRQPWPAPLVYPSPSSLTSAGGTVHGDASLQLLP